MAVLDVSAFGVKVNLLATNTYPNGVDLGQWADDADPVDSPNVQIGDAAVGVNGDLLIWSKGVPLPLTINCVPGSQDDQTLQALWDANRPGQGKTLAKDIITASITYPNGQQVTLDTGIITSGPAAGGVAGAGRLKTKMYEFKFQNRTGGAS